MGAGEEHQPEPTLENVTAPSSISAIAEDLQRTVVQSKDSAIRSARSFQQASSSHIRSFQDFVPQATSQFKTYEDTFFRKLTGVERFVSELWSLVRFRTLFTNGNNYCKPHSEISPLTQYELKIAREHPAATIGVAVTAGLLIMRGPRRFLFRHTLGRFQTEEASFLKAEKHVKELNLSVDLMKNESKKLLERAALAEKDMKYGHNELMNAGSQIQRLSRSIYKAEAQAADLMDGLREISGRDALKLRAEVASMTTFLKRQRTLLENRAMKVSDMGIPL